MKQNTKKFKPKVGEKYYIPVLCDNMYHELIWKNSQYDNSNYDDGLICKTKDEAIENIFKYITKKYLSRKWGRIDE